MQLFGYDGESELRRQVARDVEMAAEPGPEVGKGAEKSGLHLKVKVPLEGRSVQSPKNERYLLVVGGDAVGEEPAVQVTQISSSR